VKTTKPLRYLVQPAQGVICPSRSDTIRIVLVEQEEKFLLQLFHEAGQAAIANSNDQFLIEFCLVRPDMHDRVMFHCPGSHQQPADFNTFTAPIWNAARRAYDPRDVRVKHLGVRHSVGHAREGKSVTRKVSDSYSKPAPLLASLQAMSKDQLVAEVLMLSAKAKYEELARVVATTQEETAQE
jgi:hypothetical protein